MPKPWKVQEVIGVVVLDFPFLLRQMENVGPSKWDEWMPETDFIS